MFSFDWCEVLFEVCVSVVWLVCLSLLHHVNFELSPTNVNLNTILPIIVEARPRPKSYNVKHKVRNPPPPTYLVGTVLHVAERLHAKRRRVCQHCRMTGVTTSSGHGVETSWNCVTCDVALCVNNRNCWNTFHDKLNNMGLS